MKHGVSPTWFAGGAVALTLLLAPLSASAASISASVSASTINSLGEFSVSMVASGVTSCVWSRLDNNTTWQWQNQPLPSGTAYNSGTISGWSGPATYEWQFTCDDGMGGSAFAATSITISSETGGIVTDAGDLLGAIIGAIIGTVGGSPTPVPAITVLPSPLVYPDTATNDSNDIHLIITNTGDTGSLLTGNVSIVGDPSFTCVSGCSYTNVPAGTGPEVVIRFAPVTPGSKTATVEFSGAGGASIPASGTGVTPPVVIIASPQPVIDVSPAHTLFFYGVEMGDYRDKQFIIKNVGPAGTLLSGTVSVPSTLDFFCVSGCTYVNLHTTSVHPVTIRFRPSGAPGAKIAMVQFTGGGNATRFVNGDGYILAITGVLDFGNVPLNQTNSMTLTVTNPSSVTDVGSGTLVVTPPFSCIGACTYNLPPGGQNHFTITYTPLYPGPHGGGGSLSGYPNSSFTFTGTGVRQYYRIEER